MSKRWLIAALAFLAAVSAHAEVYKWVDPQGNVIFSDTPREGAELIQLKPTTILPSQPVASPEEAGASATPPAPIGTYVSVTVAAPGDDETLRDQQDVAIDVATVPALHTDLGHTIQLYVDGAAYGAPTTEQHFSLPTVDRGTHQLAAAVLDANGAELIRSATTAFHLHKTSVANRKTKPSSPPKSSAK